jgi:pimeloyl-ACP methyl ester carboxylesterase
MIAALWVLSIVLVLYFTFVGVAAFVSIRPIRVPHFISPAQLGLPQEDMEIKHGDLNLRGWWVEHPNPKLIVIGLHGYICNRSELAPYALPFYRDGYSSLYVDFRAHGRSSGSNVTFGHREREDVREMVAWAKQRQPGVPIVLFGSSMGAAAAALAAGDDPDLADVFVFDGVYRTLGEASAGWWDMMGGRWMKIMLLPTIWLGRMLLGFAPESISVEKALVKICGKPVLLLNGTADPLVKTTSVEANLRACGGEIVWFQDAGHGHGRFKDPERFEESVIAFLRKVAKNDQ